MPTFSRPSLRTFIPGSTLVLVLLVSGSLAFSSEINDATRHGDLEKIKALLIGNPSLVNSKDLAGRTPLHWAAIYGLPSVAKQLLSSKADVNATDKAGFTPLHYAASSRPYAISSTARDVVDLLLAEHADVNARTVLGDTPLHLAARTDNQRFAELLCANGADTNARNNAGMTPLDLVSPHNWNRDLRQSLRERGGRPGKSKYAHAKVNDKTPQTDLSKIATSAVEAQVRADAAAMLTDKSLLAIIALADTDNIARAAAATKLDDQGLLTEIATGDPSADVRAAAASRLTDQAELAKIALKDTHDIVRYNAAGNILDSRVLTRIASADCNQGTRVQTVADLRELLSEADILPNTVRIALRVDFQEPMSYGYSSGKRVYPLTKVNAEELHIAIIDGEKTILALKWDAWYPGEIHEGTTSIPANVPLIHMITALSESWPQATPVAPLSRSQVQLGLARIVVANNKLAREALDKITDASALQKVAFEAPDVSLRDEAMRKLTEQHRGQRLETRGQ